jgi:sugar phosphate isomerase/epimerase
MAIWTTTLYCLILTNACRFSDPMKLSFYTYSYTDRLKLPVADCLTRIAKVGYAGIDESGTFGASEDPHSVHAERRKRIHDTARQQKLTVEAVVTHAELTTTLARKLPLDLKGTVDIATDLGARVVTFHMGGSVQDHTDDAQWRSVVEALRPAVRYAEARHVSIAVDGIWPTWLVHSPETLQKLFDAVGGDIGVNFDPCYLVLMGLDPVSFVRRFESRIRHVHLKDYVGKYPKWEHRIPGQGDMDYIPIFAALAKSKFTGSMAVECFTDMKFEEACDQGYAAMTAALRKAGV